MSSLMEVTLRRTVSIIDEQWVIDYVQAELEIIGRRLPKAIKSWRA